MTTLRTFYQIDMTAALVAFFISYVLMLLFTWKFLKRDFNYMLENCESRQFWIFCLIPLLDYVYSFAKTKYNFIQPFAQEGYWIRQIPTIIVFTSYILLIHVFRSARENQQLENQTAMMQMQLAASETSVENLRRTQQQAATYRHDLRHHVNFLRRALEDGQVDRALDYLGQIQAGVESITPLHFCENETANLLFSAFAEWAKQHGIALSVRAELPSVLTIPDTELCTVLSNGLENALHAVDAVENDTLRKIAVDCRVERNMVLLEIENAYTGIVKMADGLPVSSEKDHGYGCRSMRSIAEQRKGFCTFRAVDGIFTLRVVLPMEN